jgi:AraC-like DNA-binding protein
MTIALGVQAGAGAPDEPTVRPARAQRATADTLRVVDLDSTSSPPNGQRRMFEEFSDGIYQLHSDDRPETDLFRIRHRAISYANTTLSLTNSYTGFDLEKSTSAKGSKYEECVSLIYRDAGNGATYSEDSKQIWDSGSLIFVDVSRPIRYLDTSDSGSYVRLRLHRDIAQGLIGEAARSHNSRRQDILAKLLGEHLVSAAKGMNEINALNCKTVAAVTNALIAATFAPTGDNLFLAKEPLDAGLYVRACRHIDRELFSASLTPDSIAAAVGVSRRKLYRLFEAHGGVHREITARRLDRAHEILAGAATYTRIKQVAYALGFQSAAHFSRSFKQRFGHSPGDVASRKK